MTTVGIREARTQLSRLLDRAAAGEEIIIARAGKPMARLVPLEDKPGQRKLGLLTGQIKIAPDFDALPADLAEAFRGELP
jgi:prevent-host-death family protein